MRMLRTPLQPSTTYVLEKAAASYDARVHLWLAGFDQQRIVSVEDVVSAIRDVPPPHLEGLKGVIYDGERVSQELIRHPAGWSFTIKGVFFKEQRCVVLYEFPDRARFRRILHHEIGHHVFYHVIDSDRKKRWVTDLHPNSRHVSAIAKRNASEDFAECYATFLEAQEKLVLHPEKLAFLRRDVFRGAANPGMQVS